MKTPRRALHASLRLLLAALLVSCASPGVRPGNPAAFQPRFASDPAAKKLLSFDEASSRGGGALFGGRVPSARWASDGVHIEMQERGRTVRIDPETGERTEVEDPEAGRREELKKALEELETFDEKTAARAAGVARLSDSEGEPALVDYRDDLYFQRSGGRVVRLTDGDESETEAAASPDGRAVAFVRGNDLHVVDTETAEERRVTTDGSEEILNGRLDWVYQEEVYGRGRFRAHWWSPDSRRIAFLRIDQSAVHPFTVIDHIPTTLETEVVRYPKAGDPNPVATLGVTALDAPEVVWLDLSMYEGEEILIVRVGWTPDGSRVVFQVQNRIQTWLDLNLGDPETGEVTRLLRESSDAWVNVLDEPEWLPDGSFVWASERSGYKHLYLHEADGRLVRPLTTGAWEVRRVLRVDPERGWIWFTGARDGAIDENAYRVGLDGRGLRRLTKGSGTHSIRLNEDGSRFLDTFSSLETPPELRLCDGDGRVLRVLEKAEIRGLEEYVFVRKELLEIPARDGFVLDATLLKPPSFDPERRYPVWLSVYCGPDSPTVRNRWDGNAWHQFLAQQGYLVFQVNNRSSSGKGQVTTATCYERLGEQELEDLLDAVEWLCANPWADATRVGIYGWSYGGFMAGYALVKSEAFALGVAGAGVFDWRLYDTIYTERYMSTPQLNPEGYDRSSCLKAAADLHGHLVLLHGTMDDNVHFQNTVQFAYELQKAGKSFDLMLYPRSRHGVREAALHRHLRGTVFEKMLEHIPPDPVPEP
jgi:dipeptidyl-peptidase-4